MRSAFQRLQDIRFQRLRGCGRGITINDLTITPNQELGKVPLNTFRPHHAWRCGLQLVIDRRSITAVHINLAEHRKTNTVVFLTERTNIIRAAGFLLTKLIAWKAKYDQSV